jgi:predicted phage-related endonuclease
MGNTPQDISASRGAAILGLSKWGSAVEVWLDVMETRHPGFCEKNGYTRREFDENMALFRWGNGFESAIAGLAECKMNCPVKYTGEDEKLFLHPEYNFITSHPDGIYNGWKRLHEGKITNGRSYRNDWGEPGTDMIPRQYTIQVQQQLFTSGFEEAILSVLVFPENVDEYEKRGRIMEVDNHRSEIKSDWEFFDPQDWATTLNEMGNFHQYKIKADPELHKMMLERYKQFWYKNVLENIVPDPKDFADLKRLIKAPKGTIVADEETKRNSAEYKQINDENKGVNKRKDFLKKEMMNFARKKGIEDGFNIDDESCEKLILVDDTGRKLHSWGKQFR